jgi:hypothetical protein
MYLTGSILEGMLAQTLPHFGGINMLTTRITIQVDDEKKGKWYAKKMWITEVIRKLLFFSGTVNAASARN